MGGIVTVVSGQAASLQVDDGALADEIVMQHAKRGPCDGTRWTQVHAGSVGREGREPGEDSALLRVQGDVGRGRARYDGASRVNRAEEKFRADASNHRLSDSGQDEENGVGQVERRIRRRHFFGSG